MKFRLLALCTMLTWGCASAPTPMIPPIAPELANTQAADLAVEEETEDDDGGGFGEDPLTDADMQQDVEEDQPAPTDDEQVEAIENAEKKEPDAKSNTPADAPAEPPK